MVQHIVSRRCSPEACSVAGRIGGSLPSRNAPVVSIDPNAIGGSGRDLAGVEGRALQPGDVVARWTIDCAPVAAAEILRRIHAGGCGNDIAAVHGMFWGQPRRTR